MAKNMAKADEPGPKHNQHSDDDKMKAIRLASETIAPIEAERNQLRTKLNGKNKEINKIIRGLRDCDITAERFKLLRDIAMLEDESDQDAAIQEIRPCMEALVPGSQGNLLPSDEDVEAAKSNGTGRKTSRKADGRKAGKAGAFASTNPYDEGTDEHEEWHEGWVEAQAKRAGEMKKETEGAAAH